MSIPPFDEALDLLREVSNSDEVGPEDILGSTDVDSLDLLEWVADLGIDSNELTDELDLMQDIASMSIRDIYNALVAAVEEGKLTLEVG
jgi:hypothetical protein